MKVLNIDEWLKSRGIRIVVGGNEYLVRDVPLEALEEIEKESYRKAVALVLGCSEDDLKDLGLGALTKIVEEVQENLFPERSREDQSQDLKRQGQ